MILVEVFIRGIAVGTQIIRIGDEDLVNDVIQCAHQQRICFPAELTSVVILAFNRGRNLPGLGFDLTARQKELRANAALY